MLYQSLPTGPINLPKIFIVCNTSALSINRDCKVESPSRLEPDLAQARASCLVMPKFGSEPRFEPEPLGPNPKFGSRFRAFAEPNPRSSSRFSQS